jgi:staphylococcal nuclease domain-containing protein 1
MAQGSATVKQILSGDSVLLQGAQKDPNKAPPELKLLLSSTKAPTLAMKSAAMTKTDEPWAWECREALRELTIGKAVEFKVDYTLQDRQFGTLTIGGKNVAEHLINIGLAQVQEGASKSPHIEELQQAQSEAQAKKLGMWGGSGSGGVPRSITYSTDEDFSGKAFLEKHRGEKLTGIVEWVRDAGHVRMMFLPAPVNPSLKTYTLVGLSFTGLQVEGFKRDQETKEEKPTCPVTSYKSKHFLEFRIMNRKLETRVEAVDQFGNLFGTLYHPKGVISKFLVTEGFAKVGGPQLAETEFATELRDLQKAAQASKKGRWHSYVAPSMGGGKEFHGKVAEIVSGDCIMIRDVDTNEERRVYLSSTKAPKQGRKDEKPEPWAWEAKEFLRKKFIGKKVKVTLDYTREPMGPGGTEPPPAMAALGTMHFCSVLERNLNLAAEVIAKGYAKVAPHRADDDTSEFLDDLVEAEKKAAEAKLGLHSDKQPPAHRFNDLVGQDNANKAKQMAGSIVRMGKVDGMVDFVFNAGRFKVRLDRENLFIPLVLAGIKVPQTARTVPRKVPAEPFAEEAYAYVRDLVMQQEVTVEVHTSDRGGNCLGSLFYKVDNKPKNLAETLCELGFCRTVEFSLQGVPYANNLLAAEALAKKSELRVHTLEEESDVAVVVTKTYPAVEVVHINGVNSFYIQESPDPTLNEIQKNVASAAQSPQKLDTATLRKGMMVITEFYGEFYRAQIVSMTSTDCEVLFVDYGNTEKKKKESVKACPGSLSLQAVPARAYHMSLGGLTVTDEYSNDAARCFQHYAQGKLKCGVEYSLHGVGQCVLTSVNGGMSMNERIVSEGLARQDRRQKISVAQQLEAQQQVARRNRLRMWEQGDNFDDDDWDH